MVSGPILVTGGSGQVGGAVARLAAARGIEVDAPGRDRLDLTDQASMAAAVAARRWAAIINCAAYTAVDKAENEPELAHAINAAAPGVLAREAAKAGIPILHVSTDYVFDGSKGALYTEADPVNPLGIYGQTKEAGEQAVRAANPNHFILRTAWVVSASGANFINTMLRFGAERPEMRVVADQHGCPTNADDIAEALLAMADQTSGKSGTWHFVNGGEATWHDFAARVFAETARRGMPTPVLRAITTADYPTPAKRPANSRLATDKITADFGIVPRAWEDAIDAILAERLGPTGD